jgi:hypothetical protein
MQSRSPRIIHLGLYKGCIQPKLASSLHLLAYVFIIQY